MRVRRVVKTARDVRMTLGATLRADYGRSLDKGWHENRTIGHDARHEEHRPKRDATKDQQVPGNAAQCKHGEK
jgi:hypothetical protein